MELMEFLSLIHLPMPILGSLLFLLGLVLIRFARQAADRPHPPAWLCQDMTSLIVATVLSLPLSFGLGFLLAAVMQAATGQGGSPFALLAALVMAYVGWRGLGRVKLSAQPAQA